MKKKFKELICALASFTSVARSAQEGFVITPVADLLGKPMRSMLQEKAKRPIKDEDIIKKYNTIAEIADDDPTSCPRIYQLLFNERVTILEQKGPEVKVKVPYALYGDAKTGKLSGIYWTLKKNVATAQEMGNQLFERCVPKPINDETSDQKTIVLKKPYFDRITKQMYSAGTRFICRNPTNKKQHTIILYNPKTKIISMSSLPASHCLATPRSNQEKYKNFILLLRQWALDSEKNPIPYIWGGASCTSKQCSKNNFALCGFDCAGLIIRAAQSTSLPFLLKNSSAIKHHLKEVTNGKIKNGDIIWIPGHVMIISDKDKNRIIEARGYSSGYGKVHELPLNKAFNKIQNYQQLVQHFKDKKPLELLDKNGKVSCKISSYSLLSFSCPKGH